MVYSKVNKQIMEKAMRYEFQGYELNHVAKIKNKVLRALMLKDQMIIKNMPYVLSYGIRYNLTEKQINQFIKIFKALNDDYYSESKDKRKGCGKQLMTARTNRNDAVFCGEVYNEKLHLCEKCSLNKNGEKDE